MKILVVGSGGREHALAWKLNSAGHTVLAAPGNPGIARVAQCLDIGGDASSDAMVDAARRHAVDLVVIGPEAPLVAGLSDRLRAAGVAVFGPGADGARLEGSKVFCKEFFARHGVPTARFFACSDVDEADRAIAELGDDVVVKADGLAAGKGVIVCSRADDARAAARLMLAERRFGDAGSRVVIEERLSGRELSVMAITDGQRLRILAQAEDHKALHDGDRGPNTGGMGAVSPCHWVSDELLARVEREVFAPTLRGLAADGIDYRGVLYAGLMIDTSGDAAGTPWTLEYNCRFGDPETQAVLPRLDGDLAPWLAGAAQGRLPDEPMRWLPHAAVCVILASAGYPSAPEIGKPITGPLVDRVRSQIANQIGDHEYRDSGNNDNSSATDIGDHDIAKHDNDLLIFHSGTAVRDGQLVSAGGRVLGVTALGPDLAAARRRAYDAVATIHFEGMHARTDIGARQEAR
jgi:phosphoribosylamine--glycine ligase